MRNSVSNLVKIAQNFEENLSNGPKNVKIFSKKNAEFINANDRNFKVLRNLILRKRAKFALINSALIYSLKVILLVIVFPPMSFYLQPQSLPSHSSLWT